jgi:hypothetical protein
MARSLQIPQVFLTFAVPAFEGLLGMEFCLLGMKFGLLGMEFFIPTKKSRAPKRARF